MDTDFLSKEAYNLICMAESFDDTLKTFMGASCSQHENEDGCLKEFLELYDEIEEEPEEYFEDWGIPKIENIEEYKSKLDELRKETKKVMLMDESQKHFEEW